MKQIPFINASSIFYGAPVDEFPKNVPNDDIESETPLEARLEKHIALQSHWLHLRT